MLALPKNIENICRLCLTVSADGGDMLPLFPVRGGNPLAPNTVVSKILQCTSVKIEHYEGAPATICEFCNTRLEDWQSFREQCVGTDEYLKTTYRNIFCPPGTYFGEPSATQGYGQTQNDQDQQQSSRFSNSTPSAATIPAGDGGNYEILVDDGSDLLEPQQHQPPQIQQQDQTYDEDDFFDDYDNEDDSAGQEQVMQVLKHQNGVRLTKWSREFGAKLNTMLHVVGGDRPHQCKVCRKRFLRRPHCRRHVAQAHPLEVEDVKLPPNWQMSYRRRFTGVTRPVQRVIEPTPPSPIPRDDQYEPTPDRPHQCEVCKKCFKRTQHLRRHKTAHLQIEIDRSEIMQGIYDQQKAQQQLETLVPAPAAALETSLTNGAGQSNPVVEDDDVIALSDDDEDEPVGDDDDMGEEISPEEFNGFGHFLDPVTADVTAVPEIEPPEKRPRLSDIPHLYDSGDDEETDILTKNGTIRRRAPPMEKIPGERPYQCKECNKTFKRSDHLKSHLKTHTDATEFNCEYCDKGFRYRQNFLIHMKNKTCLGERSNRFQGHMMSVTPTPSKEEEEEYDDDDDVVLGD